MTLKDIIKKLGLSDREIEVYLALVKMGPTTASHLGDRVGLPRQTVYSLLQRLMEEEFVEQSDRRGVKHFFADPEALVALVDKKKRRLEESKTELERELPRLLAQTNPERSFPKLKYYEGVNGLKRLFEEILKLYHRGLSKTFRGYGINMFHQYLGDYLYEFVKKRGKYGVTTKLFIADAPDDFGVDNNQGLGGREIKKINMPPQEAGVYIVGDNVYLFSYKDSVGVTVKNKAIATLLKTTFDDHWTKS